MKYRLSAVIKHHYRGENGVVHVDLKSIIGEEIAADSLNESDKKTALIALNAMHRMLMDFEDDAGFVFLNEDIIVRRKDIRNVYISSY